MKQDVKVKWVEALRSGKYTQTKKCLQDARGYCCLGVLCDIVEPEGWRGYIHKEASGTPDGELLYEVGMGIETADMLSLMNDTRGKTFAEIADYIDANL